MQRLIRSEGSLKRMELQGRRVTVMGLGRFGGGVATTRWLLREGAEVTVTDLADAQTLSPSLEALAGEPVARFSLGGHREEDFRHADVVVVNPAVPPEHPYLQLARESGAEVTSETALLLARCPAPIIGITGSNGKSTVAAMTAAILRQAGRRTWLGGNIGNCLLGHLDRIRSGDWVVLELSSFQLWHAGPDLRMPQIAVVTGCTPNHLDWHSSYAQYVAAKQRILLGQTARDAAVLNAYDAEVAGWRSLVCGRLVPLPALPPRGWLSVPGWHNRLNAACATAAAEAAGIDAETAARGLRGFRGLPQRLQRCAVIQGRHFYNDSASTTPESTIAALEAIDRPVWLLAGGKDKGTELTQMIATVVRRGRGAAFFGTSGELLHRQAAAADPTFPCTCTQTMAEALRWCWQRSRPAEAIVLSPGCASTDQFPDFRARGEQFSQLVDRLSTR